MKKAVVIAILMLVLLPMLGAAQPSPNEPEPFTPEDVMDAVSGYKTVADWVEAAGRADYDVRTEESDGMTRIYLGETDSSAIITVSVPENELIVGEDGDSYRASDDYYEVLPEKLLSLPVMGVEFVNFDWLGLPLPRGGKLGDSIDSIIAQYPHMGSPYDPNLLYDITALYPGADPAQGDYGLDTGDVRMIAGGYRSDASSADPAVAGPNTVTYLWVSSPNPEDWKEYGQIVYVFDDGGACINCFYAAWTDPE